MANAERQLSLDDLSKAYGGVAALSGVSLSVRPGEVHALLGGNGSGKSTLIKVLAGVESGDAYGAIAPPGEEARSVSSWTPAQARQAGLRFVHQDLGLLLDLNVMENLFIERAFETRRGRLIPWRRLRGETEQTLERFGIRVRPRTPVAALSAAQRVQVAVARELSHLGDGGSGILVLDEATASLPAAQADELLAAVRRYSAEGHAVLFVTHRLAEVHAVADRVTVLRYGKRVGQGDTADISHDELVQLIAGRAIDSSTARSGVSDTTEQDRSVAVSFTGVTTSELRGLDLNVRAGEVVGLAGGFHAGHEHVTKVMFGLVPRLAGAITVGDRPVDDADPKSAMASGIAFVPADRASQGLFGELSVLENLTGASLYRYKRGPLLNRRRERREALGLIRQFEISPPEPQKPARELSGGNQQKVVAGRWLNRSPRVLLLEEPTQGVDVGGRADIWRQIRASAGAGTTVIVLSADYEELARECERVLVFGHGVIADELRGDFDGDDIAASVNHAEKASQ